MRDFNLKLVVTCCMCPLQFQWCQVRLGQSAAGPMDRGTQSPWTHVLYYTDVQYTGRHDGETGHDTCPGDQSPAGQG